MRFFSRRQGKPGETKTANTLLMSVFASEVDASDAGKASVTKFSL